jgi:hypothetical protein
VTRRSHTDRPVFWHLGGSVSGEPLGCIPNIAHVVFQYYVWCYMTTSSRSSKYYFISNIKNNISLGSSQDQGTVKDCPKRLGRISDNFVGLSYHILLELMMSMIWSRFCSPKRVERTLLLGILNILRSPFYSFSEESGQCLFEAFFKKRMKRNFFIFYFLYKTRLYGAHVCALHGLMEVK